MIYMGYCSYFKKMVKVKKSERWKGSVGIDKGAAVTEGDWHQTASQLGDRSTQLIIRQCVTGVKWCMASRESKRNRDFLVLLDKTSVAIIYG